MTSKRIQIFAISATALVIVSAASFVGYALGQRRMHVKTMHAYYLGHGDGELLRKYRFPCPFLKKKIEQENLVRRDQIDPIVYGYADRLTKCADDGSFQDIYVFHLVRFGKSLLYVGYDKDGRLQGVDEQGPSIYLRK